MEGHVGAVVVSLELRRIFGNPVFHFYFSLATQLVRWPRLLRPVVVRTRRIRVPYVLGFCSRLRAPMHSIGMACGAYACMLCVSCHVSTSPRPALTMGSTVPSALVGWAGVPPGPSGRRILGPRPRGGLDPGFQAHAMSLRLRARRAGAVSP